MKKLILSAAVAATAIMGAAAPAFADPYHGDSNRFEQRSDQRSFRGHEDRDMGRWQHREWRGGRFARFGGYHRGYSKMCFHRLHDERRG